jgi:hypothetical protein
MELKVKCMNICSTEVSGIVRRREGISLRIPTRTPPPRTRLLVKGDLSHLKNIIIIETKLMRVDVFSEPGFGEYYKQIIKAGCVTCNVSEFCSL